MTIYSQHAHRGKSQVLATYQGPDGVVSATVTSLESAELAGPVVEALNRISAAATVPVSVPDERGDVSRMYPRDHLAVLTNPGARPGLLTGGHSLWYAMATWTLHEALTDLDRALEVVPAPVVTAVRAELETEARWLRLALAEYNDGEEIRSEPDQRVWEFNEPFVAYVDSGLATGDREMLDRGEVSATSDELEEAADDLRLLLDAHARSVADDVELDLFGLGVIFDPITMPPAGEERFLLSVDAPVPDSAWPHGWGISLHRWVDDEFNEEGDPVGSESEEVLYCALEERPLLVDVVQLLDQAGDRMPDWAHTPHGETLAGTEFVVTRRPGS
jgi:hypothetical protein